MKNLETPARLSSLMELIRYDRDEQEKSSHVESTHVRRYDFMVLLFVFHLRANAKAGNYNGRGKATIRSKHNFSPGEDASLGVRNETDPFGHLENGAMIPPCTDERQKELIL